MHMRFSMLILLCILMINTEPVFSNDTAHDAIIDNRETVSLDTVIHEMQPMPVESVNFSPDGRYLALSTGSTLGPGHLVIWDMKDLLMVHFKEIHTLGGGDAVFTPDGTQVYSTRWDGSFRVYDMKSGTYVTPEHKHQQMLDQVRFSPDGKYFVSCEGVKFEEAGQLQIRKTEKHRHLKTYKSLDNVNACAFTPDSRFLVASLFKPGDPYDSDPHYVMRLFRIDGNTVKTIRYFKDSHIVRDLDITPDGKHIVSGGWSQKIILWSIESGKKVKILGEHDGYVSDIEIASDGSFAVSVGWDSQARLWDLKNLKPAGVIDSGNTSIALHPDDRVAASGSWYYGVTVMDCERRQVLMTIYNFEDASWILTTPDGFFMASEELLKNLAGRPGESFKANHKPEVFKTLVGL